MIVLATLVVGASVSLACYFLLSENESATFRKEVHSQPDNKEPRTLREEVRLLWETMTVTQRERQIDWAIQNVDSFSFAYRDGPSASFRPSHHFPPTNYDSSALVRDILVAIRGNLGAAVRKSYEHSGNRDFLGCLRNQIKLLSGIDIKIEDGPGDYRWIFDPTTCQQVVPSDPDSYSLAAKSGIRIWM
jgi:hypothetical protein